jgi:beta-galactosidase
LELNGKVIGEKPVSDATKLTAKFDVRYAPGALRAIGLIQGKAVAETILKTSGAPKKLKLIADRGNIRADRNDLSYVMVEIVDADGQRVPDAEVPVRFSVAGAGELAAQASSSPNTPASFRAPSRRTFEGRCLVILRPTGSRGKIQLRAEADGLKPSQITVTTR